MCRMIVRKLVHLINNKGNFLLEEFLVPAAVNYLRKEMDAIRWLIRELQETEYGSHMFGDWMLHEPVLDHSLGIY